MLERATPNPSPRHTVPELGPWHAQNTMSDAIRMLAQAGFAALAGVGTAQVPPAQHNPGSHCTPLPHDAPRRAPRASGSSPPAHDRAAMPDTTESWAIVRKTLVRPTRSMEARRVPAMTASLRT